METPLPITQLERGFDGIESIYWSLLRLNSVRGPEKENESAASEDINLYEERWTD